MFKVQRFTSENQEGEGGSGGDDSTSILNQVLERAKARVSAKRARLEPGSDSIRKQDETGLSPLDRQARADSKGIKGDGGTSSSRKNSDETLAAPVEEEEEEEEDEEDTSDEEVESSSGEEDSSGEEGEREGEDGGEQEDDGDVIVHEKNAEIGEDAADGREKGEDTGGGQGLRPMEEVAEEWGLDSRLAETLREEGVKHFFPIQVTRF